METLFKESIFPGTEYFVAQTRFVQKPATGLHNHNFYEAFIVESGSMAHVINGNRAVMHPYSLALVFPEDTHEFLQLQEDEVRFVNLAFSEEIFRTACRMYEAASDKPLQNGFAAMQLDPELGRQLIGRIYSLNRAGFGDRAFGSKLLPALVADIFMLSDTYDDTAPAMPQWLVNACEKMRLHENFTAGLPRLVKLCGKSQEHITRVMRESLGQSPTGYINALRLDYAAEQLSATTQSVLDISIDAGFQNLSHFNKLFKQRFHMTPRQYRDSARSIIGY